MGIWGPTEGSWGSRGFNGLGLMGLEQGLRKEGL